MVYKPTYNWGGPSCTLRSFDTLRAGKTTNTSTICFQNCLRSNHMENAEVMLIHRQRPTFGHTRLGKGFEMVNVPSACWKIHL